MVICKYFKQGNCKFGDRCKFEHQLSDPYHYHNPNSGSGTSILRQSTFANQNQNVFAASQPAQKGSIDINTLVKSVVNDNLSAEKGGQWLLSSYAPFKEKAALPGFTDFCFEEIRWQFYQAQKNGTQDKYVQELQGLLREAAQRVKTLQNPSEQLKLAFKTIFDAPPSSNAGTFSAPVDIYTNSPSGNTFQQSIFATANANYNKTSIFSQNQNAQFPINSVFGGSNTAQQTNTSNNFFTNQANSNSSPFGQSIFSGAANPNQNPSFGQPAFPTQSSTSIFSSGPFGTSSSTNIFGGGQSNSETVEMTPGFLATTPSSSNMLSVSNTVSTSTVGTLVPNENTLVQNQSPFGQANAFSFTKVYEAQKPTNIFGNANVTVSEEGVYSKMEDLKPEDVAAFQSETFELHKIPENPPPRELCL